MFAATYFSYIFLPGDYSFVCCVQLTKIQSGLMEGDVLYNRFVKKTAEQVSKDKARRQQRE